MPRKSRGEASSGAAGASPTINVEAVLAEAVQLHEQGNIQAAVERYARVLQQEPENPPRCTTPGFQYQSGQPSAALELMWRSVRLFDQEPESSSATSAPPRGLPAVMTKAAGRQSAH